MNESGTPVPGDDEPSSRRPWMRLIGLGTELATWTLIPAGIGYWIDSHRQHEKLYATAACTLAGFTLGMIRFIREARKNGRDNKQDSTIDS